MDFETDDVTVGPYLVSVIRDDQYIGNCLRRGYEWDGWMRQDLPYITKPGMDILDIGGNIGWNALMFSEYGPVHTFEPMFHKVTSRNVHQNMTRNPITVHPYGLSDAEGDFDFWFPKKDGNLCNWGGSSLGGSDSHEKAPVQIHVKKLDNLYTGTPCLLKIDVEGHELEVLKGVEQTIRKYKPSLYVEIFNFENGPVVKFLKELGYTIVVPRPEHNYLFVSPNNDS
jgi:FkbM family methyltransferase